MERLALKKFQILNGPIDVGKVMHRRSSSEALHMDDSSLYICNISEVIRRHQIWKKQLPRVKPFYAVKCNDNPMVIQILATLGAGFDCASKGEIAKVIDSGVNAESIIYANPTKSISHLKFASECNVQVMMVDNKFEMHKIHQFYPNARLVLRFRCDAQASLTSFGKKFGCDPQTEAVGLIELSKSLGLHMIGLSFHVGSGCMDPPIYEKAIQIARKLFDVADDIGYHFNLLDIGGGFPGDKNTNITEIANIVNYNIGLHFPSPDIDIIAEPGRFFVASAFTLLCSVHSKREIRQNDKFSSIMYFINDGIYGSFISNITDHKKMHPITLNSSDDQVFKSEIWGQTCDSIDLVCDDILLPRLNINDLIFFENMGAYTLSLASTFNGFSLPKVEYYIEREHIYLLDNNLKTIQKK